MFPRVGIIRTLRFYCTGSDRGTKAAIGLRCNDEQTAHILGVLNNASLTVMESFKMGKENAKQISDHRDKIGNFDSLQSVLEVEGIPRDNLIKLCKKIKALKNTYNLTKKMCIPEISQSQDCVNTVTALSVGPTHLTMAHVRKEPFEVCRWEKVMFSENKKPAPLHQMFEWALTSSRNLPESDVYVVEQLPTQMKQTSGFLHVMNVAALQASLLTLLNSNFQQSRHHAVYTIKPQTVTKYFQIGVGNERISCLDLMSMIIEKQVAVHSSLKELIIAQDLIDNFSKRKASERHELGMTLLLAIAFYDIHKATFK